MVARWWEKTAAQRAFPHQPSPKCVYVRVQRSIHTHACMYVCRYGRRCVNSNSQDVASAGSHAMVSRVTMVAGVHGTAWRRPVHASQASHDLIHLVHRKFIKRFAMQCNACTSLVSRAHIWKRMCVYACMYACGWICMCLCVKACVRRSARTAWFWVIVPDCVYVCL